MADQPNTFGTAAAAQRYHGIDANRGFGKNAPGQPGGPDDLMAQLDCHFDNRASAATNSNSVLEQLATTMTDQYSEIKASRDALATTTPLATQGTRSAAQPLGNTEKHKLKCRIRTLKAGIKNKWEVGGICSTHGHGVSAGHNSKTCRIKGAGHVDSTTRKNPAGVGKEKNKGWDAWLP